MAARNLISNSQHKISHQNGKTTFPKEFFHKIWLISEGCKCNYIAERKIVKSYSVALLWGKQIVKSACKVLTYANMCTLL